MTDGVFRFSSPRLLPKCIVNMFFTLGAIPNPITAVQTRFNAESHNVNVGTGIPPKITIKSTTTTIPAITKGIKKRKTASAITAIIAIISRVNVDPSNASISTAIVDRIYFVNLALKD